MSDVEMKTVSFGVPVIDANLIDLAIKEIQDFKSKNGQAGADALGAIIGIGSKIGELKATLTAKNGLAALMYLELQLATVLG